jgi:hypothetical protein
MRTSVREDLSAAHYRHTPDTTNILPIYAPNQERACEIASSCRERTVGKLVGIEQGDGYVPRFGTMLPKTIYVCWI